MARRNRSVDLHAFSMIPRADIPRSQFRCEWTRKMPFDSGILYPLMVEEVLPADTMRLEASLFARLATPIFPVMDNLWLDTFFFFVPARLLWTNWVRFQGEQSNPGDSISYTIPQVVSPAGGFLVGSIFDHFGLPTVGQIAAGNTISVNALPLRAYNLIFNKWFQDENLVGSTQVQQGDGPDLESAYQLKRRGKRYDYFTGCLPWPQKGAAAVSLPLGSSAPVKTSNTNTVIGAQQPLAFITSSGANTGATAQQMGITGNAAPFGTGTLGLASGAAPTIASTVYPSNLFADLSAATAATINSIRLAFQTQRLLERDARGGTRYAEIVRSHFGVVSPDARLQRPEYLGGGSSPITISPVAQTSNTPVSGTPQGNLAGFGTAFCKHGFSQSFTEHGYVIGLVNVRADLTYQQGIRKMWKRSTRYDFYMPVFANLGEQPVLNYEIYADGSANDTGVFGYQERWGEYRHHPSEITGLFRSTAASTIDPWHLAQRFTGLPVLNETFISDTPPLSRVLAVGAAANGQQLLLDAFFSGVYARAMPLYSVPGNIDRL